MAAPLPAPCGIRLAALALCACLSASGLARGADQGHFRTSEPQVRAFAWTRRAYTSEQALNLTFPDRAGWVDLEYTEAAGSNITWEGLAGWIEQELLGGANPFAEHNGTAPVPWPESEEQRTQDQLSPGQWASYSRRQVCYIVAQSLLGANTVGYANGLFRFLDNSPGWSDCTPRTGDFGKSLFSLLAACAADPSLSSGAQGPMLLVAKAGAPQSMEAVREAAREAPLASAGLRVCQYGDGTENSSLQGVPKVPHQGCQQPTATGPGRDFMTGGRERLQGQAIVDISAAFIGGYIYGNVCGLGGGQDERLLVYMPEVTALAFFLSEAAERPQLRVPAWILGARMLFVGLDGTGRFDSQLRHDPDVPLRGDLVEVALGGKTVEVSSSRPFLAFMSESQGFLGEPEAEHGPAVRLARRNRLPQQREVNSSSWFAFEKQVRAWYTGVSLASYSEDIRQALRQLVRSVGTGPWLAGLWWGDSQLGFLAVWLGQAIAASSWGVPVLPLEYYLYSAFTESPGNQCFVHSAADCRACIERCVQDPLPDSAFWLPDWSLLRNGSAWSCAGFARDCGKHGLEQVVEAFGGGRAASLWNLVETSLSLNSSDASRSVFDLLLATPASPRGSLRGAGGA